MNWNQSENRNTNKLHVGYSVKQASLITSRPLLVWCVPELWLSLGVPGLATICRKGLGAEVWDVSKGSGTFWGSSLECSPDSTVVGSPMGSVTITFVPAGWRWRLFWRSRDWSRLGLHFIWTGFWSLAAHSTWVPFLCCLVLYTHRLPSCQRTKISCTPIMVVLHWLMTFR